MSLLQSIPFNLSSSGPSSISGVGNYYLQILPHIESRSQQPLSTLYFLDSHSQIRNPTRNPDYAPIAQDQIDWFRATSRALRHERERAPEQASTSSSTSDNKPSHLALAFFHIPLPEFGHSNLHIHAGERREPTEGPSVNTHFYDALKEEGVAAIGCGHDHVNDFCALLPQEGEMRLGPWLCHAGAAGFGGYGEYDGRRVYRRMRIWEMDTERGMLSTWLRVEYNAERVEQVVLVDGGESVTRLGEKDNVPGEAGHSEEAGLHAR